MPKKKEKKTKKTKPVITNKRRYLKKKGVQIKLRLKAAQDNRKEKRKAEKHEIPKWLKPLWYISAPFRAIGRYFRDSFRELRQVRWPNRKMTWKITFSVIVYVIAIVIFIMLLDALLKFLSDKLLGGTN